VYVCFCQNINEKQLKEVMESKQGATLKEVQKICAAGMTCGGCIPHLKEIYSKVKSSKTV
jgi:bacterioferritin-associated ferredoxin